MSTSGVGSFLLVLAVVGGLELMDRTNFALIGFAARHRPWPTWVGAASAFVVTSALAVAIGTALVAVLRDDLIYLRLGGGAFLLAYAAYLALVPESTRRVPSQRSAVAAAFLLILLLELGDTTMIFMINFVFTISDPWIVFAGGALGLCLVAASAALLGARLGERVEPRILDRVVVVVLAAVGVVTIVYALEPGLFPALP